MHKYKSQKRPLLETSGSVLWKMTALKRTNKRLDAENKTEDDISPPCKLLCPVFCALQEGQTYLRKGTVELKNMQEKKVSSECV